MTLFVLGTLVVLVLSSVAAGRGWESRLLSDSGAVVAEAKAVDLLSAAGLRWLVTNLISIFTGFAPLGLVLTAAIGIAVAERSGLISAALKCVLLVVPSALLTPATFFAGVMSSAAVDAGYIVLPPLAAAIYKAAGRAPMVGIAAVFAGVASGFNANLFITGLDPMLAGMTEAAARILDPDYHVNSLCNWWFMIASTLLITGVGWAVTAWYVEPRLSRKSPEEGGPPATVDHSAMRLDSSEKLGLVWALFAGLLAVALVAAAILVPGWILNDPPGTLRSEGGTQAFPTWITAIVPLLVVLFFVPGMAYGIVARTIRSDRDVVRMMSEYMSVLGNYIVLAFFAAIFVKCFEQSNLGRMLAIEGGNFLRTLDLPKGVLMVAFIAVVMGVNLFVGSMSAKWAMLATVFVPMFMTIGISPELTQVTYRIGDSVTNSISPLNPYIIIMLVFVQQQNRKAGLGTLISMMLPYALAIGIAWSVLLVLWIALGIPLGVEGPLGYPR